MRSPILSLPPFLAFCLTLGFPLALPVASAQAAVSVYLSAPTQSTSLFTAVTVENFDIGTSNFVLGANTAPVVSPGIGTWQLSPAHPLAIGDDDDYGTGSPQYARFGNWTNDLGPVTLNLDAPQEYFGFAWNAGDGNNGITLYDGAEVIGRFNTADVLSLLSNPTITAYDGTTTYAGSAYNGKYGAGNNLGEPYGFLNFFATGGTRITSISFDNLGLGTGFEFDNPTIRAAVPAPDGSSVFVNNVVPEPSASLFLLLAALGLTGTRRRR